LRQAYLLTAVLALALLPSNVVAGAVPLLREEWDASAVEAGWVFAAYQVGYVVSVLVILPLTDRLRAGSVLVACAGLASLSFVLFPLLAQDVWSASALRFLGGLGLAGIYMPGVRMVSAASSPERRGLAVGVYVSAFYLGSAASLSATGLLLPDLGWRGAALALGVVSAAALPLALWGAGESSPSSAEAASGHAYLNPAVLRNGAVVRNILAYTGHSWELYVSRGWLAAFIASILAARGFDGTEASAAGSQWAALMSGVGTVGVFLGGWLSDVMGRARIALLTALTSGAISLGFGFLGAEAFPLLVAVGCLYGVLLSADSAVYSTAITELAEPERLGSAQAFQAFLGFGATVLAPVAAGLLLDLDLGWGAAFAMAGVVGIALALPLVPMTRQERRADSRRP
jgi:MFS family permease